MNLSELRTATARLLNFTSGTPDQDFDGGANNSYAWIDDLINEAYLDDYSHVVNEVGSDPFFRTQQFTWAANAETFTIPAHIDPGRLREIWDVTSSDRGVSLMPAERAAGGAAIYWVSSDTLRWGESGPGSARTLELEYVAYPQRLVEASQEPDLFPPQFHSTIAWSAAILGLSQARDRLPESWLLVRDEKRDNLVKYLSRNRPLRGSPQVTYVQTDFE